MTEQKYPLHWKKKDFSIKIFCSIPNIATGILLKAGDAHFVIDPGDGILRDLNTEIGVQNLLEISDVFVTHGHHDHVGGVWSLLTYLRVMQKKSPLTIHYPYGCVEIESIYNAFKKVYSRSITYKINLKAIKKTNGFTTNNITVKPFPVIHKEYLSTGKMRQVPALGYNFVYDGAKICYGGDTAYCEELVNHARNAPLRERKEDIPLLVESFLTKAAGADAASKRIITKRCLEKLYDYHWPGNVRELQNEIERMVVLSGTEMKLTGDMLSPKILEVSDASKVQGARVTGKLKDALEELEVQMIREGLRRTGWNKSKLAKELGISRAGLIMKVEKYGLDKRKMAAAAAATKIAK